MSKFNNPAVPAGETHNFAGGEAFHNSSELELVSILLTSYGEEALYLDSTTTLERLKHLIDVVDKVFAAKAIVYARKYFGMRTITHAATSYIAAYAGGTHWGRPFFKSIVHRPDDMMEILSYHTSRGHTITQGMIFGFQKAFDKFSGEALLRYRNGRGFNIYDVINICHPKGTLQNHEVLRNLAKGGWRKHVAPLIGWEFILARAGEKGITIEEKKEEKKKAWAEILFGNKIGYIHLLRNLHNIIEDVPDSLPQAIKKIIDEDNIKSSLILPVDYLTALEQLLKMKVSGGVTVALSALSKAIDISLKNMPILAGETLVVLNVSKSMVDDKVNGTGTLFATSLVKANKADFMVLGATAEYIPVNGQDSTLSIGNILSFKGTSIDEGAVFTQANRRYDRIIILSNAQRWEKGNGAWRQFQEYKKKYKADPFVYEIDLKNYRTMQFPEKNVFSLAGFSGKILSLMRLLEGDKDTIFNEINKVEF